MTSFIIVVRTYATSGSTPDSGTWPAGGAGAAEASVAVGFGVGVAVGVAVAPDVAVGMTVATAEGAGGLYCSSTWPLRSRTRSTSTGGVATPFAAMVV